MEKIVDLMRRDDSVDAPPQILKWAKNLYRTRAIATRPTVLQRIVAALQIDLLPAKPVFGERSASPSKARQMFFKANENGVDLRISKSSKGWTILGQILGPHLEQFAVKLSQGAKTYETATGDAADFQIDNVPSGVYQLLITGEGFEIFVEKLEL